jgi:hypothetical protein
MSSYVDHWTKSLNYFGEVIAYLASDTDGKPTEEVDQLIAEYRETILSNHVAIFDNAANELKFYMNFYDVHPRNGTPDELKIFYFLGKAIAEEFEKLGLADLQRYQLKAVQRIFNKRLAEVDAYRVDLSKRIDTAIEKGSLYKDFGRFGWYIVHRCLLNAKSPP